MIVFLNWQTISSVDTVSKMVLVQQKAVFCVHLRSRLPALLDKPLLEFQLCRGSDTCTLLSCLVCRQTLFDLIKQPSLRQKSQQLD